MKNNYNRDHRKGNACNRPFANFHTRFALVYTRDQNSGEGGGGEIWWYHFPTSVSWRNNKKKGEKKKGTREMKKHRNTCKCSNRNPLNGGIGRKKRRKKWRNIYNALLVPIILNRVIFEISVRFSRNFSIFKF